ncbi:MAG: 50S ribosomal protein L6 [Acidobacteriota bacterium]|nr:50S ribosomal protein L6 [Blastocatellia bacterium]MDW8412640.1 50S ribosomal protein L6 [Acidobacteriota bacterium]
MSRIGKKPIQVPAGVRVEIGEEEVKVTGPKGTLSTKIPKGIKFTLENNQLRAERTSDQYAALHGLARALVANSIQGVTTGFTRELDIVGVGYRVETDRNKVVDSKKPIRKYPNSSGSRTLIFDLGYSHLVEFAVPDGIDFKVEKVAGRTISQYQATLTLSGIDKQLLGQVAAKIYSLRKPDAYKGKGIRYVGRELKLKASKTGK